MFQTNILEIMAIENYDKEVSEKEARQKNITKEFYKYLLQMIENDMKLNINCNAQVRSGKSTMIIKLGMVILDIMRKLGQTNEKFGIHNIMRDEHELLNEYKKGIYRTVRVVDEFKKTDETGLNATTEKALISTLSDVNAGQYIHTIRARPFGITDENTDVNLTIIGTNRKLKQTKALVYYKLKQGNYYDWILIGYIIVDVKDLIKNWEKIKNNFERLQKGTATRKDIEIIEKMRKKDFYVEYQIRKYQAIKLLQTTGYLRVRDIENKVLIGKVYKRVMEFIDDTISRPDKAFIKNELSIVEIEEKSNFSILGKNELIELIYTYSIIYYYSRKYLELENETREELYKIVSELYQTKSLREIKKIIPIAKDKEIVKLRKKLEKYEKLKNAYMNKVYKNNEELIKAKKILDEYNKIMSGKEGIQNEKQ